MNFKTTINKRISWKIQENLFLFRNSNNIQQKPNIKYIFSVHRYLTRCLGFDYQYNFPDSSICVFNDKIIHKLNCLIFVAIYFTEFIVKFSSLHSSTVGDIHVLFMESGHIFFYKRFKLLGRSIRLHCRFHQMENIKNI